MRRAHLILLVAVILVSGAAPPGGGMAPPPRTARGGAAPTIEPTLPVLIDLSASEVQWSGRSGRARIELSLLAQTGIREAVLDFRLPDGLAAEGAPPPTRLAPLAAGESRRFVVPVRAARPGVFAIRLEADLRLDDGRSVRAGQGLDLRLGVAAPEGRSIAGAYEFPGVPLEEPGR